MRGSEVQLIRMGNRVGRDEVLTSAKMSVKCIGWYTSHAARDW